MEIQNSKMSSFLDSFKDLKIHIKMTNINGYTILESVVNNSIYIFCHCNNFQNGNVLEYQLNNNKYSIYCKYPDNIRLFYPGLCYYKDMDQIILYNSNGNVYFLDLKTKKFIGPFYAKSMGNYAQCVVLHKCYLNVIGGSIPNSHYVYKIEYDINTGNAQLIHMVTSIVKEINSIYVNEHRIVRQYHDNELIILGGCQKENPYTYDRNEFTVYKLNKISDTWNEYHYNTLKNLGNFGYVELYPFLCIFGGNNGCGRNNRSYSNDTYFINIENGRLYIPHINLPIKGIFRGCYHDNRIYMFNVKKMHKLESKLYVITVSTLMPIGLHNKIKKIYMELKKIKNAPIVLIKVVMQCLYHTSLLTKINFT